jgi:hypothetical protein
MTDREEPLEVLQDALTELAQAVGFDPDGMDDISVMRMIRSTFDDLKAEIGTPPPGSHPDEARPRAATWHAERINWIAEAERLRQEVARVTAERDRLGEALEAAITAGVHILGDYRASHGCISSNWEDRDGFLSRAGIEDPNPRKAES